MVAILAAGKTAKREHTSCIRLMSWRRPGGKRATIEWQVILARALTLAMKGVAKNLPRQGPGLSELQTREVTDGTVLVLGNFTVTFKKSKHGSNILSDLLLAGPILMRCEGYNYVTV